MSIQINVPFIKRGKPTEEEQKRCDRCKKAFSQESAARPLPPSLVWWGAFFGINPGREAVKLYCESCAAWLRSLLVGVVIVGALFFLFTVVLSLSSV